MHHHCSILLEVFTCDPVQAEDVHTHMQHITSNSTGERAKLWRKLRVGHTSKVSTYTVLSAVKIVDVIIINGYSSGWLKVSMRVVVEM